MDKPVIIFGATGIARAALEVFKSNQIEVYGFLDEDPALHQTEIGNVPVLGSPDDQAFLKLIGHKCEAFVATDDNVKRLQQVQMLKEKRKVMPMNAVHVQATISETASIGHGNFINAGVRIGAGSTVDQHCILNTGVIIEHGVEIGSYVQVGAGGIINSGAKIEDGAFIGSGVLIVAGVKVGTNARVGAGSVVIADVRAGETVFGNPAVKVDR